MSTIDLNKEEIATIQQGLLAAMERYRAHVATVREVQAAGGIGDAGASALIAQFTKQADDANALYVKIVNAEQITVTGATTEEEPNEA